MIARKQLLNNIAEKNIKYGSANLNASKNFPDEFWDEFVRMSRRLNAKPQHLAAVLWSESGFDPAAQAERQGRVVAKGLNQLTLAALPVIGMPKSLWDRLETVSAIDQLKWVEKYFKAVSSMGNIKDWKSPTQLYVANFAPSYLNKASNPGAVLYKKYNEDGSLNPSYTMNAGLDQNKRGYITVSDLNKFVSKIPRFIDNKIKEAQLRVDGVDDTSKNSDSVTGLINKLFAKEGVLTNFVKESILKESLPTTDVLVIVKGETFINRLEYSRVVANILKQYIDINAEICSNGAEIEIQCSGIGSNIKVTNAVKEVCSLVADKMQDKVGEKIRPTILSDLISKHAIVETTTLLKNRRNFNMKRILNG